MCRLLIIVTVVMMATGCSGDTGIAGFGESSVETACADFGLPEQLIDAEISAFHLFRDAGISRTEVLTDFAAGCQSPSGCPSNPNLEVDLCVILCIGCGDAIADLVYGPN